MDDTKTIELLRTIVSESSRLSLSASRIRALFQIQEDLWCHKLFLPKNSILVLDYQYRDSTEARDYKVLLIQDLLISFSIRQKLSQAMFPDQKI